MKEDARPWCHAIPSTKYPMKIKLLLTLFSALAMSFSGVVLAADEDTPLSKEMTAMNKSLKTIKRQMADPAKNADNLELIGKVKAGIEKAHELSPKKTDKQADKAAYTAKFKDEMGDLSKAVGDLETAIKGDKADDAKKAMDKIYQLKEKGHKDFGVDED